MSKFSKKTSIALIGKRNEYIFLVVESFDEKLKYCRYLMVAWYVIVVLVQAPKVYKQVPLEHSNEYIFRKL